MELAYAWETFTGELLLQTILYGIQVHAFVLMPNHFHLLASFPAIDVGNSMREFLSSSTRIINAKCNKTGRLFGGPYFGSLIKDPYYFLHAYKYVIRNPVRAGLCKFASESAYSTYSGSVGSVHLPFPITMPRWSLGVFLPQDPESMDVWLNKPHKREELEAIRKGLQKREFRVAPRESDRRKDWFEL